MPTYDYNCPSCGIIEIFHSMTAPDWKICPKCEGCLTKMVCSAGAIIIAGREANQYNDILKAKYWRDKNGVRHKVQSGDGHTGSATVKKQTSTPLEIKRQKKRDAKIRKDQRLKLQDNRARLSEKTNIPPEDR